MFDESDEVAVRNLPAVLARATLDAPLDPPDPCIEFDVEALFTHDRDVRLGDEFSRIKVQRLGRLYTSGTLAVWDLGWGTRDLSVLPRRIREGGFPVEVAQAFERNVALRLLVSDRPVVLWHPAGSVGVDSGTTALVDVEALGRAYAAEVEEAWSRASHPQGGDRPIAVPLMLEETTVGFLVESGWGDGGYPIYWGVDIDGGIAALLVDYDVLSEPTVVVVQVPLVAGDVVDHHLSLHDIDHRIERDGETWRFVGVGADGVTLAVRSGTGDTLLHEGELGPHHVGVSRKEWTPESPPPDDAVLELGLPFGYRHV